MQYLWLHHDGKFKSRRQFSWLIGRAADRMDKAVAASKARSCARRRRPSAFILRGV